MLTAMELERIPVGTVVRYHGSLKSLHGEYTVTAHSNFEDHAYYRRSEIRAYYPDDEAYDLWPVGVPMKFGNRDKAIYFCRRASITVVE